MSDDPLDPTDPAGPPHLTSPDPALDPLPLHVLTARALGWTGIELVGAPGSTSRVYVGIPPGGDPDMHLKPYVPRFDHDWGTTGPLIERFKIELWWCPHWATPGWRASGAGSSVGDGDTALTAICEWVLNAAAAVGGGLLLAPLTRDLPKAHTPTG